MTGPFVFRDYDQARLDLNYNQSAWAPNAAEIIAGYRTATLAAHARLEVRPLSYGPHPAERIDLFPAPRRGAPLVVFVHGGAWNSIDRMDSAFAAPAFVESGVNFAALDFASIPAVRLPEMVGQVQRGLGWLAAQAPALGCDPARIVVVGHSSGAHLVAAALTAATDTAPPPGTLRGALCASGSFDLEAPMLSARGKYLQLTPGEVAAFSPARHAARVDCPLTVAYGERETDEFRRHSLEFHAALEAAGKRTRLILAPGMNHFEISLTLARRDGLLHEAALALSEA